MSEQVTESEYEPIPSRRQPAYGDGRFRYEEPANSDEHIERRELRSTCRIWTLIEMSAGGTV